VPSVVAAAALLLVAAACGASGTRGGPAAKYSSHVDNPWFPLRPGTIYVYRGAKDGEPSREVLTVTRLTKTIAGAPCVVLHDDLYLSGHLAERTTDWYTQDSDGNVWYFGEDTAELDRKGRVTSTEGTWQAGRDGAQAGIFMPAHPRVGASFRQELYKGHAEDHFRVVGIDGSILRTREWTPLEPGAIDFKTYRRGVGTVAERAKDGSERATLVAVRRG
jgi:hypothetical protein